MPYSQDHIRNFCIIAHIDHGKSTLADRILELTNSVDSREKRDQMLDTMDLERERGITIKMTAVRLEYTSDDGETYTLNLIDTPGHVDFSYEVSRSLNACEGALLVVDAAQGVEAQTLANVNLAMSADLAIIPVINKIDMPAADPDRVKDEIESVLAIDAHDAVLASAREGIGIHEILEHVVHDIPPPNGHPDHPLRALIFDSHFDQYLGVVAYIRIVDGSLKKGDRIRMMSSGKDFEVTAVGVFHPELAEVDILRAGEVGYVTASMKQVDDARVGDTITFASKPTKEPLPGYKLAKAMVSCGLYPMDSEDYPDFREALEKLQLNDSSLSWEPETSAALGFGFRCGFLGLLHMDIIQERLEREFDLSIIATAPGVLYKVYKTDGTMLEVDNPSKLPPVAVIDHIEEPYVNATVIVPKDYLGGVLDLCQDRRGVFKNMEYSGETRVIVTYDLPLAEILMDFYDQLKSRTKGYASFDYDLSGYKQSQVVKLDILLNAAPVDALSFITHRDRAYNRGKLLVEKLKEILPRQQFEIRIQAAIGSKVIAAENVRALRKNVTAKCYGGDITRKRKLLEKQKEGKKRMKSIGSVEVPQEAFLSVLKLGE